MCAYATLLLYELALVDNQCLLLEQQLTTILVLFLATDSIGFNLYVADLLAKSLFKAFIYALALATIISVEAPRPV